MDGVLKINVYKGQLHILTQVTLNLIYKQALLLVTSYYGYYSGLMLQV